MLITRDVSELHMRVSFKPYASTGLQHSLFLYMYFCLCSHSHKGVQCIHLTSNILLYSYFDYILIFIYWTHAYELHYL
jgi:hypothetical protein